MPLEQDAARRKFCLAFFKRSQFSWRKSAVRRDQPVSSRHHRAFIAAFVAVTIGTSTREYEPALRRFVETQWRGTANSKEAAGAVNAVASEGDRMLLTSFHCWKGLPDPLFTYTSPRNQFFLCARTSCRSPICGPPTNVRLRN